MLSDLTDEDNARLDAQRGVIRTELRARYGEGLRADAQALGQLQRLLDDGAYAPSQKYELQCVGICWGDILCATSSFRWRIIDDEYGRDPTLQWKDTSITIHALTMVSKRFEAGDRADVEWLAKKATERAQELEQG